MFFIYQAFNIDNNDVQISINASKIKLLVKFIILWNNNYQSLVNKWIIFWKKKTMYLVDSLQIICWRLTGPETMAGINLRLFPMDHSRSMLAQLAFTMAFHATKGWLFCKIAEIRIRRPFVQISTSINFLIHLIIYYCQLRVKFDS